MSPVESKLRDLLELAQVVLDDLPIGLLILSSHGTPLWFNREAQVVCTPGAGFGRCGECYARISAFNSRENVTTALARLAAALK